MIQDGGIKRSLSFDMTLNEEGEGSRGSMETDLDSAKKKDVPCVKKPKELESELVVKESDALPDRTSCPRIEKRILSKLDCLREMDQRNRALEEKQPFFLLWRYSKETKNYKIGIKKLYLLEKKNTGKNKRHQAHKYVPMLGCDLFCLENVGSKPHWVSKKTFSSVQEAAQSILQGCKISVKKSFNVYEELSRLTGSEKNRWESLKEWLPSFYVEKFDIVAYIEDSEDEEKEIKETTISTTESTLEAPTILDYNKPNEERSHLFRDRSSEQNNRSPEYSVQLERDIEQERSFLWSCKSVPLRRMKDYLST